MVVYTLPPFPITRYFIPEEKMSAWIGHFREAHKDMFKKIGVRDLYTEEKVINELLEESNAGFPWEKEEVLKQAGYDPIEEVQGIDDDEEFPF